MSMFEVSTRSVVVSCLMTVRVSWCVWLCHVAVVGRRGRPARLALYEFQVIMILVETVEAVLKISCYCFVRFLLRISTLRRATIAKCMCTELGE